MHKKFFMLPVVAMLFFLMPAIAFWENAGAAETETGITASGACGKVNYEYESEESDEIICEIDESVKYRLYADGTMLIYGNGEMGNFDITAVEMDLVYRRSDLIPWYDYRSKIKKVVVKEGVETIGSASFYGCKNLESVYWADSIKSVGDYSFYACKKLESIPWTEGIKGVGRSAFQKCSSLKEVRLPSYIKIWWEDVFAECTGLKKVYVDADFQFPSEPSKYYEDYCRGMFRGCTALEEIQLPKDVTVIPSRFVEGCTSLKVFPIPDNVTYWGSYPPSLCKGRYVLPDSVQTLGKGAFNGCSDLEELILPEGLVYMGRAFSGCSSLKTIEIPKSVSVMDETFYNCTGLTSIVIPDTVQSGLDLDDRYGRRGVFEGCFNLKSVELPSNMKCIGARFFRNCTSLKKIKLPPNLTGIGEDAFSSCSSLTDIEISDAVEKIERYAFYGCTSLKKIKLPSRLGSSGLGSSVFYGCTSLEEIDVPEGVEGFYDEVFYNCKSLRSLTIRAKKFRFYGKNFYGCKNLSKITLYTEKVEISWSAKPLFDEIKKKITIYVPKDCVKKFKKQFKNEGVDMSKVNIKPMK